jgi:hypothetical protein
LKYYYPAGDRGEYLISSSTWSPNARFLYCGSYFGMYQYDTWAVPPDNPWVRICGSDTANVQYANAMGDPRRGPDGRIYCGNSSNNPGFGAITYINKPDLLGAACDVRIRGLRAGAPYYNNGSVWWMPNMPNYALGALDVNPQCWPLAIEQATHGNSSIGIYPNPTQGGFYVGNTSTTNAAIEVELLDLTGKSILKQHCQYLGKDCFINTTAANGVNLVKIRNTDNNEVQSLKLQILNN